jgi:23S rRNA pseudouridine1911/1915/1917 synthase
MLTQPDETDTPSLEECVKLWIKKEYKKTGNVFLHAIHRLDRCVSGLCLFARTSKALSRLNEQSRLQEIQRVYVAEVEGMLSKKDGQLDHYLIHGDHRAIVAKKEDKNAKHARLVYKTLLAKSHTTLIEIELETGRYHQIRAQWSAVGHPIVGDRRYGSQTGTGDAICLHCQKLSFQHPVTKETLTFESPAPFLS